MSIVGKGHFFTIYFPGFVCFVLYLAKISGERLQDHWSSGLLWYSLAVISNSVVYGSTFTLQSILIVMLICHTLNCGSDLPGESYDLGHSMAVLLIDAFSIVILILALPGSSFYYDTS